MDDELLLNLTSTGPERNNSDTSSSHKRPLKHAANKNRPLQDPPSSTKQQSQNPPTKRHSQDPSSNNKRPSQDPQSTSNKRSRSDQSRIAKNKAVDKNTFVSSLFQPTTTASIETETVHDSVVSAPSNAPESSGSPFSRLGVDPSLCKFIEAKLALELPTKIQVLAIPEISKNEKDLFLQAQTGSGKTLSYVLPILSRLMEVQPRISRTSGIFALILAPTRELTTQIYNLLESLTRCCHWIVPGIVIGGEKKKSEKARIRKGVNVLVATPGRLGDHLDNTKSLDTSQIRWIVFDEGDRLVDLGFEETIKQILSHVKNNSCMSNSPSLPTRVTKILCSATLRKSVDRLSSITLEDPLWVSAESSADHRIMSSIKPSNLITEGSKQEVSAPSQLIQKYLICPAKLRLVSLAAVLRNVFQDRKECKVIVFFSCSDSVDFHYAAFNHIKFFKNYRASLYKLHGSLTQTTRSSTLSSFAFDTLSVLFCTDLASRGLDLPAVRLVVEYDPPFSTDNHLHRVGRTARAGHDGMSTIFLLPGPEESYVEKLKELHSASSLRSLTTDSILKAAFTPEKWQSEATSWHLDIERWLLKDARAYEMAKAAFTSHIRAYATHSTSERVYFDLKQLHLGHVAKSFALRDAPGAPTQLKSHAKTTDTSVASRMMKKAQQALTLNEFNLA